MLSSILFSTLLACGVVLSPSAFACSCIPQDVATAKGEADVVFAGKVDEVTIVDTKTKWEPRVIVKFLVARVWKGSIGRQFTMHTSFEASSCGGFPRELIEPGNNLLVYAYGRKASDWKQNRLIGAPNSSSFTLNRNENLGARADLLAAIPNDSTIYTTSICSRTTTTEYAVEDFEKLGNYQELSKLEALPDAALVESQRPISNGLPEECGGLSSAKAWGVIKHPEHMKELLGILELGRMYSSIPKDKPAKYRDYWVTDRDDRVGMCRVSLDDSVVCGEANIIFVRKDAVWSIADGRVSTYCKSP